MENSDPYPAIDPPHTELANLLSQLTPEEFRLGAIHLLEVVFSPLFFSIVFGLVVMAILLVCSALISGSEVAFFSLPLSDIEDFKSRNTKQHTRVLQLLQTPEKLLATILIANNFVNVAIIILSNFLLHSLFVFSGPAWVSFLVQTVVVTFLLLLFGEIVPKVYAASFASRFALFMAAPIGILNQLFSPLGNLLIYSTSLVNKGLASKKEQISIDDLSHALDLASNELADDKQLLEGIVKYGNIEACEILRPRVDVVAVDIRASFTELLNIIVDSGYSRIPVYQETFDDIKGILYIKDLLPHYHKGDNFKWQSIIRPSYFVPQTKPINDLLEEFQAKKIHMAIVIDEYGGTKGIVTLEDILEEVMGEDINDEYDQEPEYPLEKIDDKNYFLEGKTLINDFYKHFSLADDVFCDQRGDADTLAGLILELKGEMPLKGETFVVDEYTFSVEAVDNRRIKKLKVTIP